VQDTLEELKKLSDKLLSGNLDADLHLGLMLLDFQILAPLSSTGSAALLDSGIADYVSGNYARYIDEGGSNVKLNDLLEVLRLKFQFVEMAFPDNGSDIFPNLPSSEFIWSIANRESLLDLVATGERTHWDVNYTQSSLKRGEYLWQVGAACDSALTISNRIRTDGENSLSADILSVAEAHGLKVFISLANEIRTTWFVPSIEELCRCYEGIHRMQLHFFELDIPEEHLNSDDH